MKKRLYFLLLISSFGLAQTKSIILGRPTATSVTASILFDQNVQYQLIKQFEDQTKAKEISEISFLSNGSIFKGKIYKIKNTNLKYKVLASGIVNNQPLVLNLSFKNEPKSNTDFDQLMQNFIKLKD